MSDLEGEDLLILAKFGKRAATASSLVGAHVKHAPLPPPIAVASCRAAPRAASST